MSSEDEDVQLLSEVGFTKTQAKLYLTLLKLGKTDGKTLSKFANTPRPVVYRALDELQKMGLVEREIALPYKFKATPLKHGLRVLMNQRLEQYEEDRKRMESFLLKKSFEKVENFDDQRYQLKVVEGKERIIQI